jgi:hypothetical protein
MKPISALVKPHFSSRVWRNPQGFKRHTLTWLHCDPSTRGHTSVWDVLHIQGESTSPSRREEAGQGEASALESNLAGCSNPLAIGFLFRVLVYPKFIYF